MTPFEQLLVGDIFSKTETQEDNIIKKNFALTPVFEKLIFRFYRPLKGDKYRVFLQI